MYKNNFKFTNQVKEYHLILSSKMITIIIYKNKNICKICLCVNYNCMLVIQRFLQIYCNFCQSFSQLQVNMPISMHLSIYVSISGWSQISQFRVVSTFATYFHASLSLRGFIYTYWTWNILSKYKTDECTYSIHDIILFHIFHINVRI